MRDYGKIAPQFWTGETGKAIRAAGPQVQVVACYLMTGPSSTMWGCYYLPLPTMCHEVGCSSLDARKALKTLSRIGFAHYDECSEHVWIPNMAHFQIGESLKPKDKRIPCIIKALEGLRTTPFLDDFLKRYQQVFCLHGVSPIDAPSMPLDRPSEASISSRRAGSVEQKQNITPPAVNFEGDEFNRLWEAYPKKVGKEAARKTWDKLDRTLPAMDVLLRAVQQQKQSRQWQKDNGEFIPHLSTWLNKKRWEDEMPKTQPRIPTSMVELL